MPKDKVDLSVLIPTYNEEENISDILLRLNNVLASCGLNSEIIVIDDSSIDNTAGIARGIIKDKGKVIVRKNKPASLSLSILDGIAYSRGEYVLVMDADGSHPPELIPGIIKAISSGCELIIASRYIKGGGFKDFPLSRRLISWAGCLAGRLLTGIKDNTSGYFCIKKSSLGGVSLTPRGFKIGLEIFVKARYHSFVEVPYIFCDRRKGKSKLSKRVFEQYFRQFIDLAAYKIRRIFKGIPKQGAPGDSG